MESNTADDAPNVVIDTPYVSAGLRTVTTLVGLAVVMLLLLPDVKGRYEAVAVLTGMYALIVVGMWVANVRVSFHREYLAIERGLGSMRLVTRVEYQRMGRVRPSDRPVNVTIDLLDGQKIYIADSGARIRGDLPEVEFKEGASARPMHLMRRIAKLVDQRIALARARDMPT